MQASFLSYSDLFSKWNREEKIAKLPGKQTALEIIFFHQLVTVHKAFPISGVKIASRG